MERQSACVHDQERFRSQSNRVLSALVICRKEEGTARSSQLGHQIQYVHGRVDRMDQNVGNYRIGVRSKKWWWPVLVFCIETSVHNAWQLYRKTEGGMQETLDFLEFRRAIVQTYLLIQSFQVVRRTTSRWNIGSQNLCALTIPTTSYHHHRSRTDVQCLERTPPNAVKKCSINLHENCFKVFHNQ